MFPKETIRAKYFILSLPEPAHNQLESLKEYRKE
jgi:hypothetical protein